MQKQEIIVITGNAGKTTTTEMIASILQTRWNIFKTKDNYNTAVFVEEYQKEINQSHQAVVLEYGMRFPGGIAECCRLVQPNIGVITNIGLSHIGKFKGDLTAVAAEKSELIKSIKQNGKLYLNADDENSRLLDTNHFSGDIIYISIKENSSYQAYDVTSSQDGIKFKINLSDVVWNFNLSLLGKHNVYNVLFAIAVASQLGFTPLEIKVGLRNFKQLRSRLHLYKYGDFTIIDDTYNASPESVIAAIDVLCEIGKTENIAVLSGTFDQDNYSEGYVKIGKHIASQKKISFLYTMENDLVGAEVKIISKAAIEAGFPAEKVMHFKSISEFYLHFKKHYRTGTTCLMKGVRSSRLVHFFKLFPLRDVSNIPKIALEKIDV